MPQRLRPFGASQDGPRRWRAPTAVFVLTLGLTFALATTAVVRDRRAHAFALASEGRAVTLAIEGAIDVAFEREQAVVALFNASQDVTDAEFHSFIADVGFTPGMFGIGIIIKVDHDALHAFEGQLAIDHPGSFVFELEYGIVPIPAASRGVHYPIRFFESPENLPAWGFDIASDQIFATTYRQSLSQRGLFASPFLTFPGRGGSDGVVLFRRVVDQHDTVIGVVAAGLDLSDLVAGALSDTAPSGRTVDVIDVGWGTVRPEASWVGEIEVANRTWLVLVDDPSKASLLVGGVIGLAGLLTATALAYALSVMGGRLRQRREMERLRNLDRQKDDFLATVSHELRTPLTSVMGFVDELIAAPADLPVSERHEMMRIVADEAHAMEGIVQDLLAAARLQTGSGLPVVVQSVPDLAREVASLAVGRHVAQVTPAELAIVGDFDADAIAPLVEELFGHWAAAARALLNLFEPR